MESATAARARLHARQQNLTAELEQIQRQLTQLDTTVLVSQWWQAPSGSKGRGTVYHAETAYHCRPENKPEEITLYEALDAGLAPCGRCRPRRA
ncbi:hypothetical protein ACWGPD_15375 [Streptomyces hirsutus]|uniref:hypothetical protein n=1 Tax=Streptomyces hirsutus TaxID=35620 RepID=UPI0036277BAE